ncbi:MAG: hypothetical protein U0Q18_37130 [Bryobacteraceae bacterium]
MARTSFGLEMPPGGAALGGEGLGGLDGLGRFVRRESFAEQEKVLEAALVHPVEARLVAVEQGEFGTDGEAGEGGRHAGAFVAGRLGLDGVIEQARFHGPGAAQAPGGGDHFFDETLIHSVAGGEAGLVLGGNDIEALTGFAGEHDAFGEQAVADGVLRRARFAFRSDRAAGAGSVGAGGPDAAKRRGFHSGSDCTPEVLG